MNPAVFEQMNGAGGGGGNAGAGGGVGGGLPPGMSGHGMGDIAGNSLAQQQQQQQKMQQQQQQQQMLYRSFEQSVRSQGPFTGWQATVSVSDRVRNIFQL